MRRMPAASVVAARTAEGTSTRHHPVPSQLVRVVEVRNEAAAPRVARAARFLRLQTHLAFVPPCAFVANTGFVDDSAAVVHKLQRVQQSTATGAPAENTAIQRTCT